MKKTFLVLLLTLFTLTGCSFGHRQIEVDDSNIPSSQNDKFIPSDFDNDYDAKEVINYGSTFEQNYNATCKVTACYTLGGSSQFVSASGFVYKTDGNHHYVVTNASRIGYLTEDQQKYSVTYNGLFEFRFNDGRKYKGNLVGSFMGFDIAVFDIETSDFLPTAILGSSDALKIGEDVDAIGTPDLFSDLFNTYIEGIVSGLNRKVSVATNYHSICQYSAFQFDAPTNNGMQGGVVLNNKDEVVGIITHKQKAEQNYESLSFAIAIDDAINIIDNIIENKEFKKQILGFSGITLDYSFRVEWAQERDIYNGIFVKEVNDNTKASLAGLPNECIITGVKNMNGEVININNMEEFQSQLVRLNEGDYITLIIATKTSLKPQEIKVNL